MKAYAHMDIRQMPVEIKDIIETFEGTPEECYAWGLSKRDEFLDLTGWIGWEVGYNSVSGDLLTMAENPNDFIIFLGGRRKDILSVHYYGD